MRTFLLRDGSVIFLDNKDLSDYSHGDTGIPDYRGLPLDKYISVLEIANPMHRLWSDGRWNKLMLAHGCYWHQCSFCDVSLDYIKRYSATSAEDLVDRIEAVISQTGERGFHFVDEAAPLGFYVNSLSNCYGEKFISPGGPIYALRKTLMPLCANSWQRQAVLPYRGDWKSPRSAS